MVGFGFVIVVDEEEVLDFVCFDCGDKIGIVTNIDEAIKFITDSKLDRE